MVYRHSIGGSVRVRCAGLRCQGNIRSRRVLCKPGATRHIRALFPLFQRSNRFPRRRRSIPRLRRLVSQFFQAARMPPRSPPHVRSVLLSTQNVQVRFLSLVLRKCSKLPRTGRVDPRTRSLAFLVRIESVVFYKIVIRFRIPRPFISSVRRSNCFPNWLRCLLSSPFALRLFPFALRHCLFALRRCPFALRRCAANVPSAPAKRISVPLKHSLSPPGASVPDSSPLPPLDTVLSNWSKPIPQGPACSRRRRRNAICETMSPAILVPCPTTLPPPLPPRRVSDPCSATISPADALRQSFCFFCEQGTRYPTPPPPLDTPPPPLDTPPPPLDTPPPPLATPLPLLARSPQTDLTVLVQRRASQARKQESGLGQNSASYSGVLLPNSSQRIKPIPPRNAHIAA